MHRLAQICCCIFKKLSKSMPRTLITREGHSLLFLCTRPRCYVFRACRCRWFEMWFCRRSARHAGEHVARQTTSSQQHRRRPRGKIHAIVCLRDCLSHSASELKYPDSLCASWKDNVSQSLLIKASEVICRVLWFEI